MHGSEKKREEHEEAEGEADPIPRTVASALLPHAAASLSGPAPCGGSIILTEADREFDPEIDPRKDAASVVR
jgi:hypothetical protein